MRTIPWGSVSSGICSIVHELAHLLLGHEDVYFDSILGKDDEILDEPELQANAQARDWLLPPDAYSAFVSRFDFSKAAILEFAEEIKRYPGIVVGRLQKEGTLEYRQQRALLERVWELANSLHQTVRKHFPDAKESSNLLELGFHLFERIEDPAIREMPFWNQELVV